jgi:hypothetical protein
MQHEIFQLGHLRFLLQTILCKIVQGFVEIAVSLSNCWVVGEGEERGREEGEGTIRGERNERNKKE